MKNLNTVSLSFCLIVTFIVTNGMAQKKLVDSFVLHVNVEDALEGQKVYLRPESATKGYADSAVVIDGRFRLSGKVDQPQLYYITIEQVNKKLSYRYAIPVFVENKDIHITAKLELMYTDGYPYEKVSVSGSQTHILFNQYSLGYERLKTINRAASQAYSNYLNPGNGIKKQSISHGIAAINEFDQAKQETLKYIKSFIKANSSSPVALFVALKHIELYPAQEIDEIMSFCQPKIKSSAQWIRLCQKAKVIRASAVGSKFVDHKFKDLEGRTVKISDFAGKGKYTLVEFWASWCGPCRLDIPHLKEVYRLYNDSGFQVLSISIDENKVAWRRAVNEEQMPWEQVVDLTGFDGALSKGYNFDGIPACVLIAPDGIILSRNMRGSWMDKKLIKLYGNKFGAEF
jgi:thiol-disulfide isomerase/thioredoxin